MYKIIGGDGQIYGPVPANTIHDWVASRRATADTQVQAEGTTEWKRLGDVPEFAGLFGSSPPPVPGSAAPPLVVTTPAKTSGMATVSFVLGLIGCLGITALVGLVLGIVALVRIDRSQGRLGGRGLAIGGICVSAVMLVLGLPMLAGLMLPALAKAKARAQTIQCGNKMRELATAATAYAQKSGNKLPDASNWCDALKPHLNNQNAFYCPSEDSGLCAYGFNAALSGRSLDDVNPSTVMFFEIPGGWNVSGGQEQMLQEPRHLKTYNVVFVDGSWRQMTKSALQNLRWDP